VALGEAEFVACGEQAVRNGGGGRKFVGFGEEGGGVAFADLEIPVWWRGVLVWRRRLWEDMHKYLSCQSRRLGYPLLGRSRAA
jgi:hypothetical protein